MRKTRYHDLPFHDLPRGKYRELIRNPALEITRENMAYIKEKFGISLTAGADIEGYAVDEDGRCRNNSLDTSHLWNGYEGSKGSKYIGTYAQKPYFSKIVKEAGDGQYEVATQKHPPDFVAMLFSAIRVIATRDAKKYGVDYIDFGDKPFPGEGDLTTYMRRRGERSGSAGHIHIGGVDELGQNIFHTDEKYSYHPLMHHMANTILPVLREATLVFGSTEASYDRFKGIMNNPESISLGREKQKGTALRVTHGDGPHFEVRYGGASMDPYLAMAVITSAMRQALDENVQAEVRPTPPRPEPKPRQLDFAQKLALKFPLIEKAFIWVGFLSKSEMDDIKNPPPPPPDNRPKTYRHLLTPEKLPASAMHFPIPGSLEEAYQIFAESKAMERMLGKLQTNVVEYYGKRINAEKAVTREETAALASPGAERFAEPPANWRGDVSDSRTGRNGTGFPDF